MMNNLDKLNKAINLLESINCPESIIDALWVFSLTVHDDYIKSENWNAWSEGLLVKGGVDASLKLPNGETLADDNIVD